MTHITRALEIHGITQRCTNRKVHRGCLGSRRAEHAYSWEFESVIANIDAPTVRMGVLDFGVHGTSILDVKKVVLQAAVDQPWGAWGVVLDLGVLGTPILGV